MRRTISSIDHALSGVGVFMGMAPRLSIPESCGLFARPQAILLLRTGPGIVMKTRLPAGLLLGLLVVASIDQIPDPPAIRSQVTTAVILTHQANAKVPTHSNQPRSVFSSLPLVQVRWTSRLSPHTPKAPRDEMIVAGYATNASPPVCVTGFVRKADSPAL